MLVKTLKTYFSEELLGYYPETEITSFSLKRHKANKPKPLLDMDDFFIIVQSISLPPCLATNFMLKSILLYKDGFVTVNSFTFKMILSVLSHFLLVS